MAAGFVLIVNKGCIEHMQLVVAVVCMINWKRTSIEWCDCCALRKNSIERFFYDSVT